MREIDLHAVMYGKCLPCGLRAGYVACFTSYVPFFRNLTVALVIQVKMASWTKVCVPR